MNKNLLFFNQSPLANVLTIRIHTNRTDYAVFFNCKSKV